MTKYLITDLCPYGLKTLLTESTLVCTRLVERVSDDTLKMAKTRAIAACPAVCHYVYSKNAGRTDAYGPSLEGSHSQKQKFNRLNKYSNRVK